MCAGDKSGVLRRLVAEVLQLRDGEYQLIVAGDRLETSTWQRADPGYTKWVKEAETQEVESCINLWQDT